VFVDLGAVLDPAVVAAELAGALDVAATGGPDRLAGMELLLVLDNFEHVLDAAPALGALLAAAPRVRVLVTSRERMHLHGEREVPVAPLPLPGVDPAGFVATPSVALLLERIRALQPGFAVTAGNRAALAEICVRLDGLPLALELAAARLKLFTPAELTFRLRHRMAVLTGGARDVPDRHRTLRGALAWSHNLLGTDERVLFRRLSVFVGGWTLGAARHVCAVDDVDDLMASLVDKSLVRRSNRSSEVAGYAMLESLREFATEQLAEHGEVEATGARHCRYYAAVGAALDAEIGTAGETAALDGIGSDEGNLRAALRRAEAAGDVGSALPLAAALGWYGYTRGRLGEGRAVLDRVLASVGSEGGQPDDDALARALLAAGVLAVALDEWDRAGRLLARCVQLNDRTGAVHRTAIASAFLGHLARARGDHDEAVGHYQRAGALHRSLGDVVGVAWSDHDLGMLVGCLGDLERAAAHLRASLVRFREMDYAWAVGCASGALATIELRRNRVDEVPPLLVEAVARFQSVDDGRGVAQCLEAGAALVVARHEYDTAARLLGAAAALRERFAAPLPDADRAAFRALAKRVRGVLGPDADDLARHAGRALPEATAVHLLLDAVAGSTSRPVPPLTPREREVATLIARGRTNRQIGRALGIAEKTVEVHVHHIIAKLDVRSRAEVAAWVGAGGRPVHGFPDTAPAPRGATPAPPHEGSAP
jgi:predicted ATPase/DNA-binding NarL/FixJ family response regulator